jgi:hypothetical protein
MAEDAAKVASTYFDAWKVNDFDARESLVADDVTFVGPLARLSGVADYMEGIEGMGADQVGSRRAEDLRRRPRRADVVRPAHYGRFPRARRQLAPRRGWQDHVVAGGVRRPRTRPLTRGISPTPQIFPESGKH